MENGLLLEQAWRYRRGKWALLLLAILAALIPLRIPSLARAQDDSEEATEEDSGSPAEQTPAGGKADSGEAAAPAPVEQSYLSWLWDASGYEGLLIGIQSVVLVALVITNIMQLRLSVFVPEDFVKDFEAKLQNRDYQGAYDLAKSDDSFVAKLLAGGLGRLSKGYDEAVQGMQEVANDENMAIDHRLSYISIIGSTAPMLGLLGTVHGMVSAFSVIANSTVSPKPSELAKGITLALVTTLEGLIVALPAVVAFALFKNMQARTVLEATMAAENLMGRFSQVGKRSGGTSSPGPAAPASPST